MVTSVQGQVAPQSSGDVEVEMLLGPSGPVAALNFDLFGASDDEEPSENTTSLEHHATRPGDSTLQGSTGFTANETFTVDVTFDHDGNRRVFRGTAPASEMTAGNTYSMQLVRIS